MKKIGNLFFMAFLLLVVNSCQKEINDEHYQLSDSEIRFLDPAKVKSGDNEKKQGFVQKIINDIDKQNKEKKFIDNFIKKYGYPDWNLVRWFESSDETVAQIPVYYDDGFETEAVILCVEHKNKLHFKLFIRDDFEKYSKNKKPMPTAEKIKDLFIIFDFQKFGESSYLPYGTVKNASEISAKLKSATYYQVIETCYVIMVTTSSYDLISLRQECEYDYEWVSVSGSSGGTVYVDWYDEINGGTGTTSAPYECDCNICTVCGGCLDTPQLKSIPIPGGGGSETDIACPMCSCTPTQIVLQQTLCEAYNGMVNMESLNNNIQNLSPYQEQFIISLANLAAMHELGKSLSGLQNDLDLYSENSSLYTKYNKLNNPQTYIANWDSAYNSYTNSYDAYISPEIGDSGFQLKYYAEKNGESNTLGLVKDNLPEHAIEWALELLDGFLRDHHNLADDFIYDMHLFNALDYMDYYCND